MNIKKIAASNLIANEPEIIKKNHYTKVNTDGTTEELVSEEKFDFNDSDDRMKMFAIMAQFIYESPMGVKLAIDVMKNELTNVLEELQDEFPFS